MKYLVPFGNSQINQRNMCMSEKEKEVQKRYQQEQKRYEKQVDKINKIQKKKVA